MKKELKLIGKKYKLSVLVMFGSNVNGRLHKESDLDIGFFTVRKVDEEKLFLDLMKLFKRADIDLVNLYTHHSPILRFNVLHNGKLLYEARKGLKSNLEWKSYFDYVDFQKYYDMRSALLDKKLKRLV
jgi:predicted nucleotidyltransferase